MGMSNTFGWLSQVLKHYESERAEIKRVEATRPDKSNSDENLHVTIDIAVPLCATIAGEAVDGVSPTAATMREDGGLQVDFSPSALPTPNWDTDERASVETNTNARVEDGEILLTSVVTMASDDLLEQPQISIKKNTTQQTKGNTIKPNQRTNTIEDSEDELTDEPRPASVQASAGKERTDCESEISLARNENLPPYEDTEYLEQIYELCETFIEMAEVIDMDVSTETVRRYMTEAGIHEPSSYNTVSSSDAANASTSERGDSSSTADKNPAETPENDSEATTIDRQLDETTGRMNPDIDDPVEGVKNQQLVADGIGLPDGVTIEQLADAVESSITVHEVKRELNIERVEAHKLLKRLNLLDLVLTRVWKQDDHRISRAEIADRIRQSVTN